MTVTLLIIVVVVLVLIAIVGAMSLYVVEQQTYKVLERFGKFVKAAGPGLHFRNPITTASLAR